MCCVCWGGSRSCCFFVLYIPRGLRRVEAAFKAGRARFFSVLRVVFFACRGLSVPGFFKASPGVSGGSWRRFGRVARGFFRVAGCLFRLSRLVCSWVSLKISLGVSGGSWWRGLVVVCGFSVSRLAFLGCRELSVPGWRGYFLS